MMPPDSWTILVDGVGRTVPLEPDGARLVVAPDAVPGLLNWTVKNGTLCRDDRCVQLTAETMQQGGIDILALARLLNMPAVVAHEHRVMALAESAQERTDLLRGGVAPDFALPDLAGQTHRLSDYRGRKVLLVAWASWCGCREDLPEWQAQHASLTEHGLTVVTISQDARAADAAPFIEAAAPQHPALLDTDHVVSHQYGLINVPTVVWIDAAGRVARPPRVEHATNRFAFAHGLDCEPHLAALRRWVETGESDFTPEEARDGIMPTTPAEQQARAHHALAWHLYQHGAPELAAEHWREAIRLSPHDWTIRRGSMWLRGENPFGSEFAEAWMEWNDAGRPDYASLAKARA
jgi:peroxiredoxin